MSLTIEIADLDSPALRDLLESHHAFVREHSPPESIHAFDLTGLRAPGVTVWWMLDGSVAAACGALHTLDASHVEVKSMHTAAAYQRRGLARAMLGFLLETAQAHGARRVSLETGAQDGFAPARALYASAGFVETGPFAAYQADPNSVFMTLDLT